MRSTLTRILVGAAITATAAGAAVGAAGAAGATAKTHTTLSIVEARSIIRVGQTDTVGGVLRAAGKASTAKKVVVLERYNVKSKKWVPAKANLTGKNGWVRFTVKPLVTTRFELVFRGNSTLAGSHSGVVVVHVKPEVVKTATSLSIAANPGTIKAGSTTTIRGDLTAGTKALPKQLVFLGRWNATTKRWVVAGVNLTGPKGGVSFTRKLKQAGSVTFELFFRGTRTLAAAHSAPVKVTVNS